MATLLRPLPVFTGPLPRVCLPCSVSPKDTHLIQNDLKIFTLIISAKTLHFSTGTGARPLAYFGGYTVEPRTPSTGRMLEDQEAPPKAGLTAASLSREGEFQSLLCPPRRQREPLEGRGGGVVAPSWSTNTLERGQEGRAWLPRE